MEQHNWNVVVAVITSVLWITGPSERATMKAIWTKFARSKKALAKYRAGVTDGRRLGLAIRATEVYYREPHMWKGDEDPVAFWIPKGHEYDPLYWEAFRRALTPLVDAALEDAVDRRYREIGQLFGSIDRATFSTYQPKGHTS